VPSGDQQAGPPEPLEHALDDVAGIVGATASLNAVYRRLS